MKPGPLGAIGTSRVDATLAAIDAMDGVEFESYVAARLGRAGWHVDFTPLVGDYGVDLIAEKNGHSVAVQCKRLGKSVGGSVGGSVGRAIVRGALGGLLRR